MCRVEGIANTHWRPAMNHGLYGFGVQHLSDEISQFSNFAIAQDGDDSCRRRNAGIGSHDAIYIGVNPQVVSIDRCTEDRCAVVTASAPQRCDDSFTSGTDEACHDWQQATFE